MNRGDLEEARPVRVLVVDDHAVVRRGLETFLHMVDDIEVVGEAADGDDALRRIKHLEVQGDLPEVVLMDLVMPRTDGVTATAILAEQYPEMRVVVMTSFAEAGRVHSALSAGAAGYVLKDAEAEEVATAIRAAHRGELHLDPAVTRELTRSFQDPRPGTAQSLTEREHEVLRLVARGLSNRQIAESLFISERTARSHVSSILTKAGVDSRTQAALWAIKHGVAPPPSASETRGHPR